MVRAVPNMISQPHLEPAVLENRPRGPSMTTSTGGAGFVMFRSPEVMARYHVPTPSWERPVEKIVIGDHFYLAPFVAYASSLHEFFILGLSRKHLRLFRYRNGDCQE